MQNIVKTLRMAKHFLFRVILGFMVVTAFLSLWISNTATTAMMVPIAQQVLIELFKHSHFQPIANGTPNHDVHEVKLLIDENGNEEQNSDKSEKQVKEHKKPIEKSSTDSELDINKMSESERCLAQALMISLSFAANIGGTGTITGTSSNVVMLGQVNDNLYKGKPTGLNFARWMAFACPPMIACLIGCWICLVLYFLGWRYLC